MKAMRMVVATACLFGALAVSASVQPTSTQGPKRMSSREKGMATPPQKSLYERLGGEAAIKAVVDDVVARVAADSRVNAKFAKSDIPRIKFDLVKQLCAVTGGPCKDIKRDNKQIHKNMKVTEGEFNAFVEDLVATLDKFNVPAQEKGELLGILGPLKSQVVEVNSSATGTPLPANFKPAKPLKPQNMTEEKLNDKKSKGDKM